MRPKVELVPGTRADVEEYARNYGYMPIEQRAIIVAAKIEGRVIGIGGVAFFPGKIALAFADMSEEARHYPVSIHKAGRMALELARKQGVRRIVATATTVEAGPRWLLRLGFVKVAQDEVDVYVFDPPQAA